MKLKPTLLAAALMLACTPAFCAEPNETERANARKELDAARGELRELTRRIAELSMQLGDHGPRAFAFEFAGEPRRALIGVVLEPDENGARIAAVTPGSPAAKAGLKPGDLIVAINGKATGKSRAAVDAVRDNIGALEAGTEVTVRYQREGKTVDAKMVAERREPGDWLGMLDLPPGHAPHAPMHGGPGRVQRDIQIIMKDGEKIVRQMQHGEPGPMPEHLRFIAGGLDLNLTSLNAELGKYFGASAGVLVLENEGDKLPQLKAGDVIQVIDGQPAESVPGAMR
ncbi:MAG: PDZ domain-containing protein, partial [Xanthomonadales bacterium]|nr:PDZ domain-containing protein [Xanthomonadales bacterium]